MKARFSIGRLIGGAIIAAAMAIIAADLLLPPPIDKARQEMSSLVIDREGQWLHAFANDQGRWRFAAELDQIDPVFIERVVAVEDKRFYDHQGIDAMALARAGGSALWARRIASGASTISMQTARLLEPRPRTIGAKFIEMARALQLERRLSKQEILELYLTLAPYGGNIEGIRAASLIYFGKEPTHLTDAEQALLIALPQAPEARRPDLHPGAGAAARARVLDKFVRADLLSRERAREAKSAHLIEARKPFARIAYHAALDLSKTPDADRVIHSSVDGGMQREAEALLKAYAAGFDDGATASLLIVENKTRAVRAAVGSSGFDVDGGWIDLTAATRSPGSTLKPFIYALALEEGLIGPATIIEDMPRSFGDYTPENFDRVFRGEVRLTEALQHSLNLPAVSVLDRFGARRFASILNAAGVRLRSPHAANEQSGLAIALGGVGVTARDIAALYAALGDDGAVKPLRWIEEGGGHAQKTEGYHLMSEQTAARVSAILADAPSLAGRAPAALSQDALGVAFKTGTSYGYRDAWAAGHGGGYAVVVWVGRADGAARPGKTGRKAAAPLLFEVFDMLQRRGAAEDPEHEREAEDDFFAPPLARFRTPQDKLAPQIIFPRDGAEVYLTNVERGYAFAARGGAGEYRWYVNGEPLGRDPLSARAIWRPTRPGFYDIAVIDAEGRVAGAKVRVRTVTKSASG